MKILVLRKTLRRPAFSSLRAMRIPHSPPLTKSAVASMLFTDGPADFWQRLTGLALCLPLFFLDLPFAARGLISVCILRLCSVYKMRGSRALVVLICNACLVSGLSAHHENYSERDAFSEYMFGIVFVTLNYVGSKEDDDEGHATCCKNVNRGLVSLLFRKEYALEAASRVLDFYYAALFTGVFKERALVPANLGFGLFISWLPLPLLGLLEHWQDATLKKETSCWCCDLQSLELYSALDSLGDVY